MMKFKKVLIAFDSDTTSVNVTAEGFKMAKAMGAEIILLHVLINMMTYTLTYLKLSLLKLESVKDLKIASTEFINKTKLSEGKDIIQTTVKQGDFAESILNAAKDLTVDVLVLGSHSSIWLEEIIMGRVTNEDLQHSKIPILIIPIKKNNELNTFISLNIK